MYEYDMCCKCHALYRCEMQDADHCTRCATPVSPRLGVHVPRKPGLKFTYCSIGEWKSCTGLARKGMRIRQWTCRYGLIKCMFVPAVKQSPHLTTVTSLILQLTIVYPCMYIMSKRQEANIYCFSNTACTEITRTLHCFNTAYKEEIGSMDACSCLQVGHLKASNPTLP